MTQEIQIETTPKASSKKSKLILSLIFDAIGMLSYVVPVLAEVTDIVWAPVAGLLLTAMFKGTTGKIAGIVGFIEEAIPGLDFIPTFTLTWIYTYVIKKES